MLEPLKSLRRTFKRELAVYRAVLNDAQTPRISKMCLGLAIGYVLMPFDLIPDFIPVLGQLDDAVIVPGLVWLALKWVPPDVMQRCRETVQNEIASEEK